MTEPAAEVARVLKALEGARDFTAAAAIMTWLEEQPEVVAVSLASMIAELLEERRLADRPPAANDEEYGDD